MGEIANIALPEDLKSIIDGLLAEGYTSYVDEDDKAHVEASGEDDDQPIYYGFKKDESYVAFALVPSSGAWSQF